MQSKNSVTTKEFSVPVIFLITRTEVLLTYSIDPHLKFA